GERLGVGDALGVDGGQGEGDRDGVGGTAAPVVPVGFEGGDRAHAEDLGGGDDDLRLGGPALAFAGEGGVGVHRGGGGGLAGHAGRRVDHDGGLLLSGLEGGLVHDHVGLEQGALAQGGDGDLAADVAEVGDGVLRQPPLGHPDLLELARAERGVGRDVGRQPVGGDLGPDRRLHVVDDGEDAGEGTEGAQDRQEQEYHAAALTGVHEPCNLIGGERSGGTGCGGRSGDGGAGRAGPGAGPV